MKRSSSVMMALTMAAVLGGGLGLPLIPETKKPNKLPLTEMELKCLRALPKAKKRKMMQELRAKYIAQGWKP